MAGLLAWLILFAWVAITIIATKAGSKSFKRRSQSKGLHFFGAMLGFMPTMGIWIALICWDYWRTTRDFNEMCKQAKFKIYVTPEQWKEMVGGEEAWKQLTKISRSVSQDDLSIEKEIFFNKKKYEPFQQENKRIFTYINRRFAPYVMSGDIIYYDATTKTVRFQYVLVGSGSNPSDWLIFWIPQRDCGDMETYSNLARKYFFEEQGRVGN